MRNAAIYAIALIVIAIGAGVAGIYLWQTSQPQLKDVVETAIDAGSFTTLVTALEAADLVSVLKGEGPFTVFAPNDAAFAMLPPGTVEGLLNDKEKLTAVLTYHVVPGKVLAADVVKLESAKTVQGQEISIVAGSGVKVDNANVIQTDIEASNGVIHVIDAVLMPQPEMKDIVQTAIDAGSFTTLVAAVQAADLVDVLKGEGPFTVFAPTDAAFAALPEGVLDSLLADTAALTEILTYHVVSGKYMAADVVALTSLATVQGSSLAIDIMDGVKIGGANVIQTDIEASNGVIHVIDAVLIP